MVVCHTVGLHQAALAISFSDEECGRNFLIRMMICKTKSLVRISKSGIFDTEARVN